MIKTARFSIILLSVLGLGLLVRSAASEPAEPAGPDAVTNSTNWFPAAPGQPLSNSTSIAFDPRIVAAPNGQLMAIFAQGTTTANSDPYVSFSDNGGTSWLASPIEVHSRGGYQTNATGVYTSDNVGHVVWVETGTDGVGSGTDFRVLYANSSNWASTFAVIADRPNSASVVEGLDVAAYQNNLYAVWFDNDSIGFASKSGSGAWSVSQTLANGVGVDASRPAITVDANGGIHVLFIRQYFDLNTISLRFRVEYTQSLNGGAFWSAPVTVYDGLDLREHVDVVENNGLIHIAFGDNEPDTLRAVRALNNRDFYMSCSGNCADSASWGSAVHTSQETFDVYGADPNNLIPVLAKNEKTVFLYFHGVVPGELFERVIGVNDCNGWTTSPGIDEVPTVGDKRGIRPSIVTSGNLLHMVFESTFFDGGNVRREIRYMGTPFECTNELFFPVTSRP